ncbi:MAG TPA: hypothetical protein VG519_02685 [Pseudochrobactrum sp.]|nr:hypothetical protein [Pseudochrobactrum sp.]
MAQPAIKGDLATVSKEIKADLKLWIGGAFIASFILSLVIASLIVAAIK